MTTTGLLVGLALALSLGGCKKRKQAASGAPDAGLRRATKAHRAPPARPAMRAPVFKKSVRFEHAIYFLPRPKGDVVKRVKALVASEFKELQLVAKLSKKPTRQEVSLRLLEDVTKGYRPPSRHMLRHAGAGLSPAQSKTLQNSKQALVIRFAHPIAQVWIGLHAASRLLHRVAGVTGGLIWDEETREVFSREAWAKRRLKEVPPQVPDVSKHFTIHLYRKNKYRRLITLGLAKLGLPDLVVENSAGSTTRATGNLINLVAQVMAEGTCKSALGKFDLRVSEVRHAKIRRAEQKAQKKDAKGWAPLLLKKGTWEKGDPRNRLVEITFDRAQGPDPQARQERILHQLFGSEDTFTWVSHTKAVKAASERARARLPALRKMIKAGLRPGVLLQVKAPFYSKDRQREWMWVEVVAWKEETIQGLLRNDPAIATHLRAGQRVTVKMGEVFDYLLTRPGGKSEGNETGKLLWKRRKDAP